MEVLSMAVGLMSLVLGGFSIWLAFQFYSKGKDAETASAKTLEGIRAQTDTLQRLTSRWMDRLTRYVTEPKPTDEGLLTLVSTIADLPTTILAHLHVRPPEAVDRGDDGQKERLIADLVSCYIGLYFYTGLANLVCQAILPSADEYDANSDGNVMIKRLVDGSAADFKYMEGVLERVDVERLRASPYQNLLQDAYTIFRPSVQTADEAMASREEKARVSV